MGNIVIRDILVTRGAELFAKQKQLIPLTSNFEANLLLNDLDHHPHAFVLGCLMDRQQSAEMLL